MCQFSVKIIKNYLYYKKNVVIGGKMSMKIYLISALVGAVIGYITNWLAIKMLFKPHNEKRVFGIRIPFTQGIIPK